MDNKIFGNLASFIGYSRRCGKGKRKGGAVTTGAVVASHVAFSPATLRCVRGVTSLRRQLYLTNAIRQQDGND
jgi:hypothetical protein